MIIKEITNGIVLEKIGEFDARNIFECGQCFRWDKEKDGSYTIVAHGRVINVKSDNQKQIVRIDNTNLEDIQKIWLDYFDLHTDYGEIKRRLAKDKILEKAISFGEGIRILNQDLWEMILSFIISANNNIPRIKKIINILSQEYGDKLLYKNKVYYGFPTIEQLSDCSQEEIDICKAGFRGRYIYETTRQIKGKQVDLENLVRMNGVEAKKELMKLTGVGPKVADCIKLFALHHRDTYPIDTWVKKVTQHFYLEEEVSLKQIEQFAQTQFGELAGYAQQYLFYYGRETGLEEKI